MSDKVRVERRDGVLILAINRPEVRNAVDPETSQAIDRALNDVEQSADIQAVVLTGGPEAFCTGMDLKFAAEHGVEHVMIPERGFCGLTSRISFTKPLIAAVNGFAMAGGFELALACDFIVAGRNARFALPEVKRGLFAGAGGVVRLTRRIAGPAALEIIMTGDPIDADRALALGVVNHVTDVEDTIDKAVSLARTIANNAPVSVRISKTLSYAALDLSYADAVALGGVLGQEMMNSEDRLEGVRAFAEKRAPKWTGR